MHQGSLLSTQQDTQLALFPIVNVEVKSVYSGILSFFLVQIKDDTDQNKQLYPQ